MTFPRDLLIFLPYLSLTRGWNKTCRRLKWSERSVESPSTSLEENPNLSERKLSRQLSAQHDHSSDPEKDEVTACFQQRIGVEVFQVRSLLEQKGGWETRHFLCCDSRMSSTCSGQPSMAKGKSAEENQVSRTSGSEKRHRKSLKMTVSTLESCKGEIQNVVKLLEWRQQSSTFSNVHHRTNLY